MAQSSSGVAYSALAQCALTLVLFAFTLWVSHASGAAYFSMAPYVYGHVIVCNTLYAWAVRWRVHHSLRHLPPLIHLMCIVTEFLLCGMCIVVIW